MDSIPIGKIQLLITDPSEAAIANAHPGRFIGALAENAEEFEKIRAACADLAVGVVLNCPPADPDREAPWTESYIALCKSEFGAAVEYSGADFWYLRGAVDFGSLRAAVLALTDLSSRAIVTELPMAEGDRLLDNTDCVAAVGVLQRIGVSTVVLTGDDREGLEDAFDRLAPYARLSMGARCPISWLDGSLRLTNAELIVPAEDETADALLPAAERLLVPRIERDDLEDMILAPDGRDAHFIDPTTDISDEIECSGNLSDRLIELEDEEAAAFKLLIEEESDLGILENEMYMITRPVCLCASDPALLERALRIYDGLALYDGTWEQDEDVLHRWEQKYGMIRL